MGGEYAGVNDGTEGRSVLTTAGVTVPDGGVAAAIGWINWYVVGGSVFWAEWDGFSAFAADGTNKRHYGTSRSLGFWDAWRASRSAWASTGDTHVDVPSLV